MKQYPSVEQRSPANEYDCRIFRIQEHLNVYIDVSVIYTCIHMVESWLKILHWERNGFVIW